MKPAKNALIPTTGSPTWLGVMGGGQLGRMFTHAAQTLGYKVVVLDPAADCPAGHVADQHIDSDYTDDHGLQQLASLCAAVTTEFENVPAKSLAMLETHTFVAPATNAVAIAQDRIAEKIFFSACAAMLNVCPAPYAVINKAADIDTIPNDLLPGILKTARLGYDSKGQRRAHNVAEVKAAFSAMGNVPCVLEKTLPLAYEISVLAVRGADGAIVVYPATQNVHRAGILFTTMVPAPDIPGPLARKAQEVALALMAQLAYVGVACVEFFVLDDGTLIINEMAPRPHNSGHYTIDACMTSQFEQQVRAMARLPLGKTDQHSAAVMLNILGDLWLQDDGNTREPPWSQVLSLPGACLHLYGKSHIQCGRKMGHITFIAPTLEEAKEQLATACTLLGIDL